MLYQVPFLKVIFRIETHKCAKNEAVTISLTLCVISSVHQGACARCAVWYRDMII